MIRHIESIYNLLPCEFSLPYKTELLNGLLTGFEYWYRYVYMYCLERKNRCVTLWFYNFVDKWLCHNNLTFYSFCFSFCLEVTCSIHVFHLWFRGKLRQSRNPLLYYLVLKRNKCVVQTLFILCLLFLGEWPRHEYFW